MVQRQIWALSFGLCGYTFDGEVKAAQSVSRQRISSTLQHHSTGLVHLHDFSHDLTHTVIIKSEHEQWTCSLLATETLSKKTYRLEDGFIGLIINTVSEGVVHCIVLALSCSNVLHTLGILLNSWSHMFKLHWSRVRRKSKKTNPQVSSARKVFPILVERHSHDPVCGVEGLLYSITMVDVNVNV